MRRLLVGNVLALALVSIAAVLVSQETAEAAAAEQARTRAKLFVRAVAAPLLGDATPTGQPEQPTLFDRVMQNRVRDGSLSHITVYAEDGRVLWADEPAVVGQRHTLPDDVRGLFGTEEVNTGEAANAGLDVYVGAEDVNGTPVVFRITWPTGQIAQFRQEILSRVAPLVVGSLLLFQVAMVPFALVVTRRAERAHAERNRMRRHAAAAAEHERRRLAQHLHDGVIQDVAGAAYLLSSLSSAAARDGDEQVSSESLEDVSHVLRRNVSVLRSLLVGIYPEVLTEENFSASVEHLADRTRAAGITVVVDVRRVAGQPLEVLHLAHRVIQEGLRNVVVHAFADHARVRAAVRDDALVVQVRDDGIGPGEATTPKGHFGLRVLEDSLRDFGGTLEVRMLPDRGTELRAVIPTEVPAEAGLSTAAQVR